MASKQPKRSGVTSDLKSMAQTTYATRFVKTVLASVHSFLRLTSNVLSGSARVVCFAATKNGLVSAPGWKTLFH